MRPTFALPALVFAASLGLPSFADDVPRPPSALPPTGEAPAAPSSRGFLSRFRKPKEEVPPTPPRKAPAEPNQAPPTTLPAASTPKPLLIGPAPVATGGTLRAIPTGPRAASGPVAADPGKPGTDADARRTQATAADLGMPIGPGTDSTAPLPGGQSLSLQQALYGALTSNPDLIALRQGNPAQASAEAVEVARHFPVLLNPTVFIDYRPITLIPNGTFGTTGPGAGGNGTGSAATHPGSFYHYGQNYFLIAIRQPVEFGHQTTHRHSIAKAAYKQVQWQIVQAEMTALVQTYRFFQTAAYRREKLRVADQLADFNDKLLKTLDRRLQAGQGLPADVALAKVESRATRQQAKAARQDYITALTDLRNQIGIPETAAETEPLGEFTLPSNIPPIDEQSLVQAALQCRPDLHASQAAIEAAGAAVRLARGDMIPTTIIGPQYVQDEAGIQYIGLNLVPTLPILNSGKPLLRQRQAEERRAVVAYQQAQQRAVAQVRSAVAKWNGATLLVNDSSGLTQELNGEIGSLERLFEAGQTDLTRVQQARQRMIQLENAQLDALWAATQAQADLMLAVGVPSMIQSLLQTAEADAGLAAPAMPAPGSPPAFAPTPPTPTTNPSPFTPNSPGTR